MSTLSLRNWREIFSVPNLLSLSRIPLGMMLFAHGCSFTRAGLIVIAALSDWLDGALARRWNQTSKIGALLDPIGDKVFAGCAILLAWNESWLSSLQLWCLLSREIALGVHLLACTVRSYLGMPCHWDVGTCLGSKWFTALQFGLIFALAVQSSLPSWAFLGLPLLAGIALAQWWKAGGALQVAPQMAH